MNRVQIQTNRSSPILQAVQRIEPNRFRNITPQEWNTLVQNAREDIQPLLDFESYIKREVEQIPVDARPCFDLSQLTLYMLELARTLDFDLFKFIEQFNINLDYDIIDSKITMKPIIKDTLQIDLDHLDPASLLRLDIEGRVHLPSSEIENIILRYYYFRAFANSSVEDSLNLQTRKVLYVDFNDLLYVKLPINSLVLLLNSSYKAIDMKKLSSSLLDKVQRLDKYYLIDFDQINQNDVRSNHNPPHNDLMDDLEDLNQRIRNPVFQDLLTQLVIRLTEEIELMNLVYLSNLNVVEHIDYDAAFNPILQFIRSNRRSHHQLCLLYQIFLDPFHPKTTDRFTLEFKERCTQVINEIKSTGVNCSFYVIEPPLEEITQANPLLPTRPFKTTSVCDLKTFSFYVLQKWVTMFQRYATLHQLNVSNPNSILRLTNQLLDPKAGFCRRCYDYYKIYMERSNSRSIMNFPLEVKYVLFKYRNKVPFYRLKFADQCDNPLNPRHYNEYKVSVENVNEIQSYIVYHLRQELARLERMRRARPL